MCGFVCWSAPKKSSSIFARRIRKDRPLDPAYAGICLGAMPGFSINNMRGLTTGRPPFLLPEASMLAQSQSGAVRRRTKQSRAAAVRGASQTNNMELPHLLWGQKEPWACGHAWADELISQGPLREKRHHFPKSTKAEPKSSGPDAWGQQHPREASQASRILIFFYFLRFRRQLH